MEGNAVERFLSRHAGAVMGVLSGFDRLVFRGSLRALLLCRFGMARYLWANRVLLKDFGAHAEALSEQVKGASEELAKRSGRPLRYLASSVASKEAIAREIAKADRIDRGLICILSVVEPCWSFAIVRDRASKRLVLAAQQRKCLHLYHYHLDSRFGLMHARIQSWLPFSIQVCINGREWLARQMDEAALSYVKRDNCFTWLEDSAQAQQLMQRQVRSAWRGLLDAIARRLNPHHEAMFQAYPVDYYWSVYQSEWASDVMFRDAASLARLYPKLVHHGLRTFASPDVMRFLGRRVPEEGRVPPALKAEVVSEVKTRPEGVRIKHRLGANSIKMYDKQGSVLRVETTINDARDFKTFRAPEGRPEAAKRWHPMRKGVADLHRRAEVSQAANERYLDAMAAVEDSATLGSLAARLCKPVRRNGRRARPLNPYASHDAKLLEVISRGEFAIAGLRNRDLRSLLFDDNASSKQDKRRHAAVVSRKLALLRAHRLIRKIPRTHRYQLCAKGRTVLIALLAARNASADSLAKLAA